mgnify:CR=1 FL=1
MQRLIQSVFVAATTLISATAFAAPVSSITQYGVTWTFDKAYESGQFVSGDYWVVGPVNVVSVSPAPTGTRNGSSVNPKGGRQGYDDRGGAYDTSDNVSFPYSLQVNESLVSAVSKPGSGDFKNVGCMQSQAVLTAVAAPQPPSMLRPAYAGSEKKYLDSANIDWSLLPKLPPPKSAPSGADLLAMADRPRIDHLSSWTIQHSCAQDNWYNGSGAHNCYGREVGAFVSSAALYVMLDTPERDELAVSMIQHGIDNYGVLKAGGNWAPNGGHHNGRKWPIVFAARLLDDCDMLKVGQDYDDTHFGEDGQTYIGTNSKALFGFDCGGQAQYFTNGCSGSGAKDCRDPAGLVDGCADYRNCCTSAYWIGEALSTLLLQSKAIWGHDAFFDYVERWMSGDVSGGGTAAGAFANEMWSAHRQNLPTGNAATTVCGGGSGGSSGSGSGGTSPGGADAGTTGGSNAGGAGGSAGGGSAGKSGAAATEDDSGCGCRTAPATPAHSPWLLALLALGAVRARKSPRRARG